MIKKLLALSFALFAASSSFGMPAKKGLYKTLTLNDGTTVQAQLMGDEHRSWYQADNGTQYALVENTKTYCKVDASQLPYGLVGPEVSQARGIRAAAGVQPAEPVVGNRKGVIVLVEFSDVKFQPNHTVEYYQDVVNKKDFSSEEGYIGSVRDYYLSQSDGQLDYTFDIVGPITLPKTQKYYGERLSSNVSDKNMKVFIKDAADIIQNMITFSDYDNDNDGYVDNIFFLFAGKNEADGGGEDCIWPHMFYYTSYGLNYRQGGVGLNVYACSGELSASGRASGIGAICHEFSHCLGLPDIYDTSSNDNYGGGYWSLMSSGSYLGDSFTPCGYTAYERWFLGWRDYDYLEEDEFAVTKATPLSEGGKAYVMRNPNNTREYFIAEPRKRTGWDVNLYGDGLLIWHVDYNSNAWVGNTVNAVPNHQRCFVVCADNNTADNSIASDLFPFDVNDSFTDETTPSTRLFNANVDGTRYLHKSLYDIRRSNGYVSFKYMPDIYRFTNEDKPEGAIFYEGFKRCAGEGGTEDGTFKTGFAGSFNPDNAGWTYNTASAGDGCARFGTTTKDGLAITPAFKVDGSARLTFRAAPFSSDPAYLDVSVASGNAELDINELDLVKNKWTTFTGIITGHDDVQIKFQGYSRLILDEVLVMPIADGIEEIMMTTEEINSSNCYNLQGQRINSDSAKGIVIRNGKKFVVK